MQKMTTRLLGTITIATIVFLTLVSCVYSTGPLEKTQKRAIKLAKELELSQGLVHLQRRSLYQQELPQSSMDTFAAPKAGELPKHITPMQASEMIEQLPSRIVQELRGMYPGMSDVEIVELLIKMPEDDRASQLFNDRKSLEATRAASLTPPKGHWITQNANGVKRYLARRRKMQEEYEKRKRQRQSLDTAVTTVQIQYPPMPTSFLPVDFRHRYQLSTTFENAAEDYKRPSHPHHKGSPFKINIKQLGRADPYYDLILSNPGSTYPNSRQRSQINTPVCLTQHSAKDGQFIPVDWESLPTTSDCLRSISNIKPEYQQGKMCKTNEAFAGNIKEVVISEFSTCRILVESQDGRADCPDLEVVKELAKRVTNTCAVGIARGGSPLTGGYVGMLQGRVAYFVNRKGDRLGRNRAGLASENEQDEEGRRKEVIAPGIANRLESKGEVVWDVLKIKVERAIRMF